MLPGDEYLIAAAAQQGVFLNAGTSYLFDGGLQTGDFSQYTSTTVGSGNSLTITQDNPYTGYTNDAKVTYGASSAAAYAEYNSLGDLTELYARNVLYIPDTFDGQIDFRSIVFIECLDGATSVFRVRHQTSLNGGSANTYRLLLVDRSSLIYTPSYGTLTPNTNHVVEVYWKRDSGGGDGVLTLWLDGGTAAFTKTDISGNGALQVDTVRFGAQEYFDDGDRGADGDFWYWSGAAVDDERIGPT